MNPTNSSHQHYVLVDYDNLGIRTKSKGLEYFIHRSSEWLAKFVGNQKVQSFHFRLYGGWYENRKLTRRAQDLVIEIGRLPTVINVPLNGGISIRMKIKADMAYSLGSVPNKHLFSTLRRRNGVSHMRCKSPQDVDCTHRKCPLTNLQSILNRGRCTESSCGRSVDEFLYKQEQKLVDTMLVADTIHFSCFLGMPTCLVSADDDMWPGILTATSIGAQIFHIKPKPVGNRKNKYAPLHLNNYNQFTLED